MTTFVQAEDAILRTLKDAWDANAQALTPSAAYLPVIVYEALEADLKPHPRDGDKAWARAVVRNNDAGLATLANANGVRRRRRYGLVWIQVFVQASATGWTLASQLAEVALKAYEGKRAANGSAVFIRCSITDQPQDGNWVRKDVKAMFYWDDVS